MSEQTPATPAPQINRGLSTGDRHHHPSVPFISWRPGGVRWLYFLTPLEEIAQVRLHSYVRQLREGHERWLTFMCRKDPAWLPESGGSCDLCDRIGHLARERFVALAVELEAEHKTLAKGVLGRKIVRVFPRTREVLDEEGTKVNQPRIGLVAQAAYNFFRPLAALHLTDPLEEHTFEILREGKGKQTRFQGLKTFQKTEPYPATGERFSTFHHPIQSFQWADYSAKPGTAYTYTVVALYGDPASLEPRIELELDDRACGRPLR
jgi:hypothetical protein